MRLISEAIRRKTRMPQLYKDTLAFQGILYRNGVAFHNTFADEHCGNKLCCQPREVPGFSAFLNADNNLLGFDDRDLINPLMVRGRMLDFLDGDVMRKEFMDLTGRRIPVFNPSADRITGQDMVDIARMRIIYDTLTHLYMAAGTRRGEISIESTILNIEPTLSNYKWWGKN